LSAGHGILLVISAWREIQLEATPATSASQAVSEGRDGHGCQQALGQPDFAAQILAPVAISRLMLLKFELTESVLLGDVEAALETIKTLKVTGGAMQWMLSVRVVPHCPA